MRIKVEMYVFMKNENLFGMTYKCKDVCIYINMYAYRGVYIFICMYVCMYACMHVCMYGCVYRFRCRDVYIQVTRRRMARERRGAGSSLVSMETQF